MIERGPYREHASETLRGRAPSLLTKELGQATFTLTLAFLFAAGAVLRELALDNPLDPLAMALRLLTAAALLRGGAASVDVWRARKRVSSASAQKLELNQDALVWTSRAGVQRFPQEHIWNIGHTAQGVHLILRPEKGSAIVTLPPIFDGSPALLAARLKRWRGRVQIPSAEVVRLASKAFDAAAAGDAGENMAVVRHGWGWLRRGPFLALLFSLVFFDGTLRLPAGTSLGMLPLIGLVACALVPVGWLWSAVRDISPRKGVAMVVTPAEVIMRTRAGVLRATFRRVDDVTIESAPTWSLLDGARPHRKLTIVRREDHPIRYDEAYLGVPAEVAQTLLNAFRGAASDEEE